MKKFVSWRRVSTKQQGASKLGLEAQKDIIKYFVERDNGEIIADYEEVYTGKDLEGCKELQNAIAFAKENKAILIIAKTDRFRNTIEALKVYDDMGDGNIMFCDLPNSDKFTLTLFFALAEREALLVSIRTKAALAAKRAQGFMLGNKKGTDMSKAQKASAESRKAQAIENQSNKIIWTILSQYAKGGKTPHIRDFEQAVNTLNAMGIKTRTGAEITLSRVRNVWYNSLKYRSVTTN